MKQVRAALAQLYHYRFAYRNQIKGPKLLTVFSHRLDGPHDQLRMFLNDCGIGTAWMDGEEPQPDKLAAAILAKSRRAPCTKDSKLLLQLSKGVAAGNAVHSLRLENRRGTTHIEARVTHTQARAFFS